jgi:signal transduction histidine kinase
VSTHRFAAREAGIELRREVAAGLPALDVDPERLQIVFANLLANAIRHTPREGHIILRALGGDERVRFEVSDTGPGVPADEQARVFEKYARGASSAGSGLGLFIAREIVSAHGGTIGVESPQGQGATFWFELPLASSPGRG